MRILAIDYGENWIGLAISDPLHLTAQPLGSYCFGQEEENKVFFSQLLTKHGVGLIVVGLPLQMNGLAGNQALKVKEFAAWLEKNFSIPVILWDERLTTKQAQSLMREQNVSVAKGKKIEHTIAATLILESYLERKRLDGSDS